MNDTELKNLVLQTLGMKDTIEDWEDESNDIVQKINFVYEGQIRKALSIGRWSFADETKKLERSDNLEDYKYTNAFIIPDDFVILINLLSYC